MEWEQKAECDFFMNRKGEFAEQTTELTTYKNKLEKHNAMESIREFRRELFYTPQK